PGWAAAREYFAASGAASRSEFVFGEPAGVPGWQGDWKVARSRRPAAWAVGVDSEPFGRRKNSKRKTLEPAWLVTEARAIGKRNADDGSPGASNSKAGGRFRGCAACRRTFGAGNDGGAPHSSDWRDWFHRQSLVSGFAGKNSGHRTHYSPDPAQ